MAAKLLLHYRKDGFCDKLSVQSMDFAVAIIHLVRRLKERRETIIANQIGRSGTSIGANIREAQYAHGRADFVAKLQVALKEANETGYWLELLSRTGTISQEEFKTLDSACTNLRVMLISSIRTAKRNDGQEGALAESPRPRASRGALVGCKKSHPRGDGKEGIIPERRGTRRRRCPSFRKRPCSLRQHSCHRCHGKRSDRS